MLYTGYVKAVFSILFILNLSLGGYLIYSQYQTLDEYMVTNSTHQNLSAAQDEEEKKVLGEKSSVLLNIDSPNSKTNKVAEIITEYTQPIDGDVSVYYKNLANDETVLVNGEEEYYMASLYKLIVTLFVLNFEKEGKLHFTDQIGEPPIAIEKALTKIITESNNEYAQAIAKKYTWESIERTMGKRLKIPFKLDSSLETNALSIGTLLSDVSQSIQINDVESGYLLALMSKQQRTSKLPKYLPKNIYSHNKTGEFEQYSHDGAIFYTPKANYILVFMSKSANPSTTDEQMARMSEAIYNMLNEK